MLLQGIFLLSVTFESFSMMGYSKCFFFFFSKVDLENRQNESLDDFFQDFNEIVSSEMKTSTTPYEQGHHSSAAMNMIPYSDQSNGTFNSNGVDFNLDLTQFYINTNEADFLNSDELKTEFSNGIINFPSSQFTGTYHQGNVVDDHLKFSVLDLSNYNTKMHGNVKYDSCSQVDEVEGPLNFSVIDRTGQSEQMQGPVNFSVIDRTDQSKQMEEYSDTKISVSTPMNQFYLDFKENGEVQSGTNEDNSIVTYISKDSLQSVEYINERGQTETVMYVDQQQDGADAENNGGGITQYEIINFDEYQYHGENVDSQQDNKNDELVEVNVPNSSPVQYYGEQTDILSTLLCDKSNNIVIIAKPLKNPKVKPSNDEISLKFDEIDNNPTNIAFAKPSIRKGCRKQKLETINQIESEVVETKLSRSKVIKTITTTSTVVTETPKLPSKFMRDRRNNLQRRKRPRKLCWDSECEKEE